MCLYIGGFDERFELPFCKFDCLYHTRQTYPIKNMYVLRLFSQIFICERTNILVSLLLGLLKKIQKIGKFRVPNLFELKKKRDNRTGYYQCVSSRVDS